MLPVWMPKSNGEGITTSVMSYHDDIIVYILHVFKISKMAMVLHSNRPSIVFRDAYRQTICITQTIFVPYEFNYGKPFRL